MKKTLLLLAMSSSILFASTGEKLAQINCASCHLMTIPTPEMIPTMKAPAMDAVLFHINLLMQKDEDKKSFILDYVQNPDIKKSVCESNKVQSFGMMPSLKGKVSVKDLSIIADYLIANYPKKAFVDMIKEIKTNGKVNGLQSSPFLINQSALPHITKMLVEDWDKASLGLSDEQKTKLLVVRKSTISAVKAVKQKVAKLEAEIVEAMVDGESLVDIGKKVDEVALLKAQATKTHLKCIADTIGILTDEQLEFLLPFWDA
ncbi:MAG: hypothetical protein QM493_10990 [Sulfurovum sp.]